jgi:hypothetical protein
MNIRLTQIDGKLPNLALMKLASWHRAHGDNVHFTRHVYPEMFEPEYDRVYASAIFTMSAPRLERFVAEWPEAIVGGTGTFSVRTVEQEIGRDWERYDYEDYPDFTGSIGFTQRGCRLNCGFCVVPKKEGKPRSVNTISDIWRGEGHPKHLHLLDNDFFGQPRDQWEARIAEIQDGGFKVCFNQGINIRLINDEAAKGLASLEYRDDQFRSRRLYTAWDNLKDERIFFRGVDRLENAGIKPDHIMVYMLIGYDPAETWERILYRFDKMVERGVRPFPMVYGNRRDLKQFQRWAVTGLYRAVPWEAYDSSMKKQGPKASSDLFAEAG